MTDAKCEHCPLSTEDRFCPGQRNRGICRKADPTLPNHRPSFLERIVNFTLAVTQHVRSGMPRATDEQVEVRLGICRGCEHFDDYRCRICTCNLPLKAAMADQSCPIAKWEPVA